MRDGKSKFYRQLKIGKDTRNAIKLYRKFKYQVIRGAEYFDLGEASDEEGEPR